MESFHQEEYDFSGVTDIDESVSDSDSMEMVKMSIIDDDESYSEEEVVRKRQVDIMEQPKGLAEDLAAIQTIAKILVSVGQDVLPTLLETISNTRQLQGPITRTLKDFTENRLKNILEG